MLRTQVQFQVQGKLYKFQKYFLNDMQLQEIQDIVSSVNCNEVIFSYSRNFNVKILRNF